MFRPSRTYIAVTTTLVLLGMCLGGADTSDPYKTAKRDVVRTVLAKNGRTADVATLTEASDRAAVLHNLNVETSETEARLLVKTSGAPVYDSFALDDGKRVVIDFYNTLNLLFDDDAITPADSGIIQHVRTSLYALEPLFISRVVLDMATPCTAKFRQEADVLTVTLMPLQRSFETAPSVGESINQTLFDLARQHAHTIVWELRAEEMRARASSRFVMDKAHFDRAGLIAERSSLEAAYAGAGEQFKTALDMHIAAVRDRVAAQQTELEQIRAEFNQGALSEEAAARRLSAIRGQLAGAKAIEQTRIDAIEATYSAEVNRVIERAIEFAEKAPAMSAHSDTTVALSPHVAEPVVPRIAEEPALADSPAAEPELLMVAAIDEPGTVSPLLPADLVEPAAALVATPSVEPIEPAAAPVENLEPVEPASIEVVPPLRPAARVNSIETPREEDAAKPALAVEPDLPAETPNPILMAKAEPAIELAAIVADAVSDGGSPSAIPPVQSAEEVTVEMAVDEVQTAQADSFDSLDSLFSTVNEDSSETATESSDNTEPAMVGEPEATAPEIEAAEPVAIDVETTAPVSAPEVTVAVEPAEITPDATIPAVDENTERATAESPKKIHFKSEPEATVPAPPAVDEKSAELILAAADTDAALDLTPADSIPAPAPASAVKVEEVKPAANPEALREMAESMAEAVKEASASAVVTVDVDTSAPSEPLPPAIVTVAPMPQAAETRVIEIPPQQRSHLDPEAVALRPSAGDPLYQPVTIDFREMDLSNVVALLAEKGQINVIAGTEVDGTVTANIKDVPLIQAMELVLRRNNLGLIEEDGVFQIVPYEEAEQARRSTEMVFLQNADAEEVVATLQTILSQQDALRTSVAANRTTNVVVISGQEKRVQELSRVVRELDVAEPVIPTTTETIRLNYADPTEAKKLIESMLTPEIGKAEADLRGRYVVVTDMPMVIEQVKEMIESVDEPLKQVVIETMIADVVLRDASQTGVQWMLDLVHSRDRSNGITGILDGSRNTRGDIIGSVQDLDFGADLGNVGTDALDAGILTFGILGDNIDFRAIIAAEAGSRNAEILANPTIRTVENKEATINIAQEFPYQEITQGLTGPPVASTEFKDIGVTLAVTPTITFDDVVIVEVNAKQSSVSGITETGVPIEDKREASTTLRVHDGQTIFIGGLRNFTDRLEISKVPVLGDIPVVNFLFRSTDVEKVNTELLIFLTTHIIKDQSPPLTTDQQIYNDKLEGTPRVPESQQDLFRSYTRPQDMRDPAWKWRRTK